MIDSYCLSDDRLIWYTVIPEARMASSILVRFPTTYNKGLDNPLISFSYDSQFYKKVHSLLIRHREPLYVKLGSTAIDDIGYRCISVDNGTGTYNPGIKYQTANLIVMCNVGLSFSEEGTVEG